MSGYVLTPYAQVGYVFTIIQALVGLHSLKFTLAQTAHRSPHFLSSGLC